MMPQGYGFNSASRFARAGHRGKGFVAGAPGRIFGAVALGMAGIDAMHLQRHAEALAHAGAMPFEIVSRCLQPVVNVKGHHLSRPDGCARGQQGRGIRTAAEAHRQRQMRRLERGHRAFEGFVHGALAYLPVSALVSLNRP